MRADGHIARAVEAFAAPEACTAHFGCDSPVFAAAEKAGKQISDTGRRLTDKLARALSRQGTSEEPLPALPERVDPAELIGAAPGAQAQQPAAKPSRSQAANGFTTVNRVQVPKLALPRQAAAARAAENKAQPAPAASKAQPQAKPAAPLDRARGSSPVKSASISPMRTRSISPTRKGGKGSNKGKPKGKAVSPARPRRQLVEPKPFGVPSAVELEQQWRERQKETSAQSRSIWQDDRAARSAKLAASKSAGADAAPAPAAVDEWDVLSVSNRDKKPAASAAAGGEWDVLTAR